jgi:hypothetical protein
MEEGERVDFGRSWRVHVAQDRDGESAKREERAQPHLSRTIRE